MPVPPAASWVDGLIEAIREEYRIQDGNVNMGYAFVTHFNKILVENFFHEEEVRAAALHVGFQEIAHEALCSVFGKENVGPEEGKLLLDAYAHLHHPCGIQDALVRCFEGAVEIDKEESKWVNWQMLMKERRLKHRKIQMSLN
jgi:hypothetical protein